MIYLIDKEFIFIVILNWENPDKVGIVDSLPNFSSVVSQSHREKCSNGEHKGFLLPTTPCTVFGHASRIPSSADDAVQIKVLSKDELYRSIISW